VPRKPFEDDYSDGIFDEFSDDKLGKYLQYFFPPCQEYVWGNRGTAGQGLSAEIHAPAASTLATAPIVGVRVFSRNVQCQRLRLPRLKFSADSFSQPSSRRVPKQHIPLVL
jgi:hypothetical protein